MGNGLMKKPATEHCAGCGKRKAPIIYHQYQICPDCLACVEILKKNSGNLPALIEMAFDEKRDLPLPNDLTVTESTQELPDVLDAVRYRTRDREDNTWYVSVSEMNGHPVEVFASTAFDRDHHLQSRISNLTTITRLISLILRNVFIGEKLTLEKILTQLHRSSRQQNDLPEMLGRVLGNYSARLHEVKAQEQETP